MLEARLCLAAVEAEAGVVQAYCVQQFEIDCRTFVELEDLAGREFVLDAVDTTSSGDANGISFRLDGVVYEAIENEEDGYRSSMRELVLSGHKPVNVFPGVRVLARMKNAQDPGGSDEILLLIDLHSFLPILEVGTCNDDHYYPSFVANFQPQNMVSNKQLKKIWDEVDGKLPYMRRIRNYTKQ